MCSTHPPTPSSFILSVPLLFPLTGWNGRTRWKGKVLIRIRISLMSHHQPWFNISQLQLLFQVASHLYLSHQWVSDSMSHKTAPSYSNSRPWSRLKNRAINWAHRWTAALFPPFSNSKFCPYLLSLDTSGQEVWTLRCVSLNTQLVLGAGDLSWISSEQNQRCSLSFTGIPVTTWLCGWRLLAMQVHSILKILNPDAQEQVKLQIYKKMLWRKIVSVQERRSQNTKDWKSTIQCVSLR